MGIRKPTTGFTLVELMIVIVIIGILMAVAIPAVNRAIIAGRQTAIRMEINSLSQAVEQYMQKYGDYPPDGSNPDVLVKHMRRLFPRMAEPDLTLLNRLTDNSMTDAAGLFSTVGMDRAEALVFFLGGFSDNQLHPLTGEGGPLALAPGVSVKSANLSDYQYNATRDNAFFEFDSNRLTVARASDTAPLLSTDEMLLGNTAPDFGGADPLPSYLAGGAEKTPIVYFDSRTYGVTAGGLFNGFLTARFGGVRPYKTQVNVAAPRNGTGYQDATEAFNAVPFHNPKTFQIISPGLDGIYGSIISTDPNDPDAPPVHFVTETGTPITPVSGASGLAGLVFTPGNIGPRFQDVDWLSGITVNGHLDNITNFSTAALGDDLQ